MEFSVEDEVKFARIPESDTFSGSERSVVEKFGQKKRADKACSEDFEVDCIQ